tara:strand:+ start:1972 stop:3297 length:1326 start_codon:yes stop_codon:yes gene_type:complete
MSRAGGGGGGTSAYNSDAITLQSASSSATGVDPYIEVEYTSASATGATVTTTTTINGAQSKELSLKRDTVGIHTVQCKISHPVAVNNPASSDTRENSPIWTDKVEFSALSAVNLTRSNLRYEITKDYSRGTHKSETVNLFVQPMTLAGTPTHSNATRNIHVYPPEEDIAVKITMSGSAGESFNGNTGGQGGMSIFTYTLLKNTEYTFKLGCTVEPTSSIGRGGAGAYFYEGGRLLVCCGGGGASGWESGSNGGAGGGAGVQGQAGNGRGGGQGGQKVNTGELSSEGLRHHPTMGAGSAGLPGGKVESCTTGMYWKNQGIAPCEFMGTGKFRNADGVEIFNTNAFVNRGYKADTENYGYRHNGGNSHTHMNGTFVGGGGSGAWGGQATGNLRSGGGGGSGYTNGSVNLIFGQLGGNKNSQASALIELLTREGDKMVFLVRGG